MPLSLDDALYPGVHVPNHPAVYLSPMHVRDQILKEVTLGRYVSLPPGTDPSSLNVSALGVAPRFASRNARVAFEDLALSSRPALRRAALDDFQSGTVADGPGMEQLGELQRDVKLRLIHDLSGPEGYNANAFASSPPFSYPSAVKFASTLQRNDFIWKGDVEAAFRLIPVRPRDAPLLAFHFEGTLCVDTRLPFGHALSPYYFVNFVGRPVLYVAVSRGAGLLGAIAAYVDDFFGGSDTYERALMQMNIWLDVCRDLGVPVAKAKTFLPARVMEILGYIIDTGTMTISVKPGRIADILEEMSLIIGRGAVQKRTLERLAGKMVFCCSVVPGGRTFMRGILDLLKHARRSHHWVRLTASFRADVDWWNCFAQKWNGVEPIPPPITVPWRWLTSDASGDGGLGVFILGTALHVPLPLSAGASWDAAEEALIIAETELVAAVLLAALAAPLMRGEHVLIGVDNTVAISWLDSGTSRRPRAMRALRALVRIQAEHRIHISTHYITSDTSLLADAASRVDVPRFSRAAKDWHLF